MYSVISQAQFLRGSSQVIVIVLPADPWVCGTIAFLEDASFEVNHSGAAGDVWDRSEKSVKPVRQSSAKFTDAVTGVKAVSLLTSKSTEY